MVEVRTPEKELFMGQWDAIAYSDFCKVLSFLQEKMNHNNRIFVLQLRIACCI